MNLIFRVLLIAFLPLALIAETSAHNNPTFREDLLLTIDVDNEPTADGLYSESFSLEWPKKTVQLIWRVSGADAEKIRFSVSQDSKEIFANIAHDDRTGRLKGDGIAVTGVSESSGPFTISVHARVLDRSVKKK